jgi:hypothetical protein
LEFAIGRCDDTGMTRISPYTVWLFVAVVVVALAALVVAHKIDAWLVGGVMLTLLLSGPTRRHAVRWRQV